MRAEISAPAPNQPHSLKNAGFFDGSPKSPIILLLSKGNVGSFFGSGGAVSPAPAGFVAWPAPAPAGGATAEGKPVRFAFSGGIDLISRLLRRLRGSKGESFMSNCLSA